jgi:hypothetical protein
VEEKLQQFSARNLANIIWVSRQPGGGGRMRGCCLIAG